MEGEQSGEDPSRLFLLRPASTLSTEAGETERVEDPPPTLPLKRGHSFKLNVVQPCAGGFLQGLPPGLLPLGGLDGRRTEVEQVSSPSTRVPKAQPFSGKRSGGELAICSGGMAPDRL